MKRFHFIQTIQALPLRKYRVEIRRYLVLLLIPVVLMGFLYITVNHVITDQVETHAELMIDHFYVQSSFMLHEMQLVGDILLQNDEIEKILQADSANVMDSLYICDIIRDTLAESTYVQHAYLICEKSGNIYTDQGLFAGSSLSSLLEKLGSSEAELDAASSEFDFHMLNESRTAPYCMVSIQDDDGSALGTLVISLRMMEFLRIFYGLDAELCSVFNENVYISSHIGVITIDGFDWHNEANVSALLGKPVTCVYREQDNYTYLVAIAKDSYNRPLHLILLGFFVYALTVLVLGYLYLYQISKRRYAQISAMLDALPVSYQGDQSYEQIYENIRKSLEDYRTQRESLQLEDQEHRLHNLLIRDSEQPSTAEQFQSVGVDPNAECYYVATFFATGLHEPAPEKEHSRDTASLLHMLFRSTVHELSDQYHVPCAFCGGYKLGTAVFYDGNAAALLETVQKLSDNVMEIMTNSYTMHMQVTISHPVASVLDLPDAYEETHRLHSFAKSINSSAAMISQEDLQHGSGVLLNGDFIRQEQILINTILVRKYEAVPSMVESILSSHVSSLRKNYALAQSRLASIANVLAEGVRMASIPGISDAASAKAIGQADSVRQLEEITQQVYGRMAERSREAENETDPVTIACDYIKQNLSDQNLNVTAICDAAGISVQRLTRMFQAQFNMAIAEYMNACRIKLAKELLPNKQLTVSQIAQQVGYSNTDTFTRNFRKLEGITASEYRKALSDSESSAAQRLSGSAECKRRPQA